MHPENSKTPSSMQLPKLGRLQFGSISTEMFMVEEGQPMLQSLQLAADLAEGVDQLCERLHGAINDGELTYCSEVRALGFLSSVAASLVRGACYSLREEGCE